MWGGGEWGEGLKKKRLKALFCRIGRAGDTNYGAFFAALAVVAAGTAGATGAATGVIAAGALAVAAGTAAEAAAEAAGALSVLKTLLTGALVSGAALLPW